MGVDPQYALVSGLSVEDTVKENSSYVTPLGIVVPPDSLLRIHGENPVEYGLSVEPELEETVCGVPLWLKEDTVIYTGAKTDTGCYKFLWGIAKGDPANMLYGGGRGTHINLGVSCTTGVSGNNYHYCTVSGGYGNLAGYEGATVAGGQFNKVRGDNGFIGAGDSNRIEDASYSAIAGGYLNRIFATGDSCEGTRSLSLEDLERDTTLGEGTIEGLRALYGGGEKYGYDFIGAGSENKICTGYNGIVAGSGNEISSYAGFIGSGMKNRVESAYGFIGAGYGNYASSSYASVVGGSSNSATGISAVICNGDQNKASSNYTFVGSGRMNEASGFASFVGGGLANKNLASYGFVGGGMSDSIKSLSLYGFIGAGRQNTVDGIASSIVGGALNYVNGDYSIIGGGFADTLKGPYSGIFSGYKNKAGDYGDTGIVICGGRFNKSYASFTVICGGDSNFILTNNSHRSTIGGGYRNIIEDSKFSTISGGHDNHIIGIFDVTIGGGDFNYIENSMGACIPGGNRDTIWGDGSDFTFVSGFHCEAQGKVNFIYGEYCEIFGDHSVIIGGKDNSLDSLSHYCLASGEHNILRVNDSFCVSLGRNNRITDSDFSFTLGDANTISSASYSLAFGKSVTVSNSYEAAFYSQSNPGVVRITDVLILTPRSTFPTPPEEGMICIVGTPPNRHIYCFINGTWVPLD
ncbi:hypothetical protein J7K99_03480 [bacterium]|nr:hypothetical protein [bacterium]